VDLAERAVAAAAVAADRRGLAADAAARAATEARALGHGFVGPEHMLLGILTEPDGVAARLLERHGVTLAAAREAVATSVTDAHAPASGEVRADVRAALDA